MTASNYVEPTGNQKAGFQKGDGFVYAKRLPTAWETFQKEENIPVFVGVGTRDTRELPRADWPRMGGKGTFIQLIGTNNSTGMYVVEVPARGALKPQKHMYEERFIVLDGRGSIEVWKNSGSAKTSFEYQQWSVFSVPVNANFRVTNTSSAPALLLAVNTAPKVINMYQSKSFVFDNDYDFEDRFGGNLEDYWKPGEDFEPQPVRGRAMITTNLIPDAATTYLPLDNNRGPGHRWLAPNMVGNTMLQGWIAEYPSGRYAKAHHHSAGAILVCMRGKGFSITWPRDKGGVTPWKDGYGDLVKMQEYGPGGMISAAPGPADWFHQHFAYGKDPFRVFNYTGGVPGNPSGFGGGGGGGEGEAESGGEQIQGSLTDIDKGGRAIPYYMEDPYIREYFTKKLQEEGATFTMPEEVYTKEGSQIKVMSD
ncbi:MAG: cupin [Dehalococcoidia bacterium]|nr:cupin [Dehalococcoidia bacterium]